MSALWTSAEAEAATLGRATAPFAAMGISIDTRTLKRGDLFVALTGGARDGHEFAGAAFEAGAAAAAVSRAPEGLSEGSPLLQVAHTQRGLEDLGRAARARGHARIVGVTGSAGKTTTKEMLRLAFSALGATHASVWSYNNHWGVPLSLATMPRETEFGIFEIGMNHFGEIRTLAGLAKPHVALITTIAPAHIEFFGSCAAIADAKSEIFESVAPGGVAILPASNPYFERLQARARQARVGRILSFGDSAGADARILSITEAGEGMRIEANVLGRPVHFRMNATGAHLAGNAAGALLAVAALEGDVLNAAAALSDFAALKGRGARRKIALGCGAIELIDESYNANPASMAAALDVLSHAQPAKGGRRIAALGDMLEMGPAGEAHHAALARNIETASVDLVFACGSQMHALWEALPPSRRGGYARTSREIAPDVLRALRPGDVVLVKGSLGSRMSAVLDALTSNAEAA